LDAEVQGRGYASEAAGAALRFAHERAGLARVIAVARASNIGSRQVLGAIGMVACESYMRDGYEVMVYESVRRHDL
jgi:RimJ/RimL family protein N-acetyltransferase